MGRLKECITIGAATAAVAELAACGAQPPVQEDCIQETRALPRTLPNDVHAVRSLAKVVAECAQDVDPAARHTSAEGDYTTTVIVSLHNGAKFVLAEHSPELIQKSHIADPSKATAIHFEFFGDPDLKTELSGVELDAEPSSSDETPLRTFWVANPYHQVNTAPDGGVTIMEPGQPTQTFKNAAQANILAEQTVQQAAQLLHTEHGVTMPDLSPQPEVPSPGAS
ncbi:MAG TPA: hypothetical protein VHT70_04620 [Candidatus Saccharimonadales bacterium]|jgi:hypothetical protein|nr:hypothetical protein [Candidatus Saccharimonadales bacterium]